MPASTAHTSAALMNLLYAVDQLSPQTTVQIYKKLTTRAADPASPTDVLQRAIVKKLKADIGNNELQSTGHVLDICQRLVNNGDGRTKVVRRVANALNALERVLQSGGGGGGSGSGSGAGGEGGPAAQTQEPMADSDVELLDTDSDTPPVVRARVSAVSRPAAAGAELVCDGPASVVVYNFVRPLTVRRFQLAPVSEGAFAFTGFIVARGASGGLPPTTTWPPSAVLTSKHAFRVQHANGDTTALAGASGGSLPLKRASNGVIYVCVLDLSRGLALHQRGRPS